MIKLYTTEEFSQAKNNDLLKIECIHCHKSFSKKKREIEKLSNNKKRSSFKYCSRKCHFENIKLKSIKMKCATCEKSIIRHLKEVKKSKSGKCFCSSSCAATYNNKNKKHGNRRSKIEIWIESELKKNYPKLKINYNSKSAINSELDIYIPEFSLAFELNGIFHYKPIYGELKFQKIKNNDKEKKEKCKNQNIKLHVINISKLDKFKEDKAKKYLDVIKEHIDKKLKWPQSDSNR